MRVSVWAHHPLYYKSLLIAFLAYKYWSIIPNIFHSHEASPAPSSNAPPPPGCAPNQVPTLITSPPPLLMLPCRERGSSRRMTLILIGTRISETEISARLWDGWIIYRAALYPTQQVFLPAVQILPHWAYSFPRAGPKMGLHQRRMALNQRRMALNQRNTVLNQRKKCKPPSKNQ